MVHVPQLCQTPIEITEHEWKVFHDLLIRGVGFSWVHGWATNPCSVNVIMWWCAGKSPVYGFLSQLGTSKFWQLGMSNCHVSSGDIRHDLADLRAFGPQRTDGLRSIWRQKHLNSETLQLLVPSTFYIIFAGAHLISTYVYSWYFGWVNPHHGGVPLKRRYFRALEAPGSSDPHPAAGRRFRFRLGWHEKNGTV